ncbi:MAG TPA: hypothetical protein DIW23_07530 [Anaerolineae bacterium]|nr:hypothetical protein [Anaerolineae bacterium]
MSRLTTLIVASLTLITSLACVTLLGTPEPISQPVIPDTSFIVTPTPENVSCPAITETIVHLNSPQEIESTDFSNEENEESYIVIYSIENEELTNPDYPPISLDLQEEREDTAKHEELWDYFTALIPYEYRAHVGEFSIMTDGEGNILAAVAQTYDDPRLWELQIDIADSYDYYFFTFTLMHEFAHLLTLSPSQVPPSLAIFNNPEDNEIYLEEISACSTFHPGEGCSNPDSYINQFYDRFWFDIYEEWNEINLEEDEDLYYEKLDDFYYQYEDQFLTDYAVTHPAEDIAESFGFFIFAEKPDGDTIAEQKILFFYEYPELIEMRTQILNNLCVEFPQ